MQQHSQHDMRLTLCLASKHLYDKFPSAHQSGSSPLLLLLRSGCWGPPSHESQGVVGDHRQTGRVAFGWHLRMASHMSLSRVDAVLVCTSSGMRTNMLHSMSVSLLCLTSWYTYRCGCPAVVTRYQFRPCLLILLMASTSSMHALAHDAAACLSMHHTAPTCVQLHVYPHLALHIDILTVYLPSFPSVGIVCGISESTCMLSFYVQMRRRVHTCDHASHVVERPRPNRRSTRATYRFRFEARPIRKVAARATFRARPKLVSGHQISLSHSWIRSARGLGVSVCYVKSEV